MPFWPSTFSFCPNNRHPSESSRLTLKSLLDKPVCRAGKGHGPGWGVLKYEAWHLKQFIWGAWWWLVWKWEVAPVIELSSEQLVVAYNFCKISPCDFWSAYMWTSSGSWSFISEFSWKNDYKYLALLSFLIMWKLTPVAQCILRGTLRIICTILQWLK